MKDFILITIIFLLGAFFIMKMCGNSQEILDNSAELNELAAERDELRAENKIYKAKNDSLENVKQQVKTKIVYREREIDENILKDSSNSIVEYRQSLQENNWLPDGAPSLTFREIGIGAKLMAKVPLMQLEIDICNDQLNWKDKIIEDHQFIEKSYEQSIDIHKLETLKWKQAYEDESSFWNSKELWFGLGVVGTVAVVFATGLAK